MTGVLDPALALMLLESHDDDAIRALADVLAGDRPLVAAALRAALGASVEAREAHLADFGGFKIDFDHYGSTDSDANRRLCGEIWQSLRARGLVTSRDVQQLYDT